MHRTGYDSWCRDRHDFFEARPCAPAAPKARAGRHRRVGSAIAADPSRTSPRPAPAAPADNAIAASAGRPARSPVIDTGAVTLAGGTDDPRRRVGTAGLPVGTEPAAAKNAQASRGAIVQQVQLLREQVSGVSLDEEAMSMMKFQRAYEANARFFRAVGDALDMLMQALR